MPTYEYRCRDCGHEFEEYQPITSDPLVLCPKCGKHTLRRVMSAGGGLIFKGSGFYQTDYKKNGSSPTASTQKKDSKPESKTDSKKGDETKPAESKSKESKSSSSETKSDPPPKKKD